MTDWQILTKAIDKARWNGWRFRYWMERNGYEITPVTTDKPSHIHKQANSKGTSGRLLLKRLEYLGIPPIRILQDEGFCRFLFGIDYRTHWGNESYRKEPLRYLE